MASLTPSQMLSITRTSDTSDCSRIQNPSHLDASCTARCDALRARAVSDLLMHLPFRLHLMRPQPSIISHIYQLPSLCLLPLTCSSKLDAPLAISTATLIFVNIYSLQTFECLSSGYHHRQYSFASQFRSFFGSPAQLRSSSILRLMTQAKIQ